MEKLSEINKESFDFKLKGDQLINTPSSEGKSDYQKDKERLTRIVYFAEPLSDENGKKLARLGKMSTTEGSEALKELTETFDKAHTTKTSQQVMEKFLQKDPNINQAIGPNRPPAEEAQIIVDYSRGKTDKVPQGLKSAEQEVLAFNRAVMKIEAKKEENKEMIMFTKKVADVARNIFQKFKNEQETRLDKAFRQVLNHKPTFAKELEQAYQKAHEIKAGKNLSTEQTVKKDKNISM
jgi:hypothetical protein